MTHAETVETYFHQRDTFLQAMKPLLTDYQYRSVVQHVHNHEYDKVTNILVRQIRYMDREFSKCTRNAFLQVSWYRPWSVPRFFRIFRKNRSKLEAIEMVCEEWVPLASAIKAEIRAIRT